MEQFATGTILFAHTQNDLTVHLPLSKKNIPRPPQREQAYFTISNCTYSLAMPFSIVLRENPTLIQEVMIIMSILGAVNVCPSNFVPNEEYPVFKPTGRWCVGMVSYIAAARWKKL